MLAAWIRIRHLRHRSVVQTLALVVGQNLPLPEALRAAAGSERKVLRRVFERMAWHLEAGDRLSTALCSAMPSCPGHISGALQGAEHGGTLPSVLRCLAADTRRAPALPDTLTTPVLYSLGLLVVLPLVLSFVFVTVLPKFRDIFADFEATMPRMTEHLFEFASPGQSGAAVLVTLLLIVVLASTQSVILRNFLVRMPERHHWLPALLDGLAWHAPLLRRVAEARALARQLPLLQAAIRAGHDLPAGARQAACVGANYHARRRLRRWADLLDTGSEPASAARRVGFPPPVLRALRAAGAGGDLATTLDYLASYYRSLAVHWQRVAASAAIPLIVLLWGLCVGYVVVAVFLPLVSLIEALVSSVY